MKKYLMVLFETDSNNARRVFNVSYQANSDMDAFKELKDILSGYTSPGEITYEPV